MDRTIPIEITREGKHDVAITWKDGHRSVYAARFLRLACPCAECIEEMTGRPLIDPGSIPEDVHPVRIDAVGRYAVQITFSDGHGTGIFTHERLRELGSEG